VAAGIRLPRFRLFFSPSKMLYMNKRIKTFHAMDPQELDKQVNTWHAGLHEEQPAIDVAFDYHFFVSGTDTTTKFSVMITATYP